MGYLFKKYTYYEAIKKIIVQRKEKYVEGDVAKGAYWDYDELMNQETEICKCVPVEATHPLYILCMISYSFNLDTSGTTGIPKGIVRDTGGTAVTLSFTMSTIFDLHP